MRRIFSIASLTFRESTKSKLIIALAAVLVFIVVGLPTILKGDGTAIGIARMTLLYTIGVSFVFLSVTALWVSAASIASDVKNRTLQLVRVKPVRMWQLWIGKWLGIVFLNAILLAGVFAGVYARIAMSGVLKSEEICNAKKFYHPDLPSLESQIDEMVKNISAVEKMTPHDVRQLRSQLRHQLPYATATLKRGTRWIWNFSPDRLPAQGEKLWLRFKFQTDSMAQEIPVANCILRYDDEKSKGTAFSITDFSQREMDIAVEAPVKILDPSDLDKAVAQQLQLIVDNASREGASQIMLQPRQGLFLMQNAGRIEVNMLRAYVVLLSILALLLAVGLTAGAFFTMPVAIFATTCMILTVLTSNYVISDPDILDPDGLENVTPFQRFQFASSVMVTRTIAAASAPALRPSPLTQIADSKWVPDTELRDAVIGNLLVLPGCLAILTSFYLARKELPE